MVLAIFACSIRYLTQVPEPIVTDRPDFTESSVVVPLGFTQVESGITFERVAKGSRATTFPEVLIRRSIGNKVELRVGIPSYHILNASAAKTEGFGDLYLGSKIELGRTGGIGVAVIPAISLPVGRRGIRGESPSPEIKGVYGMELGNGFALSGMLYWLNAEENGRRRDFWQATTSLGIPLADSLGAFIEHVADFQKDSKPAHLAHAGFVYQPDSDSQFDLHFGFGLTTNATDSFLGMGYSIRF